MKFRYLLVRNKSDNQLTVIREGLDEEIHPFSLFACDEGCDYKYLVENFEIVKEIVLENLK